MQAAFGAAFGDAIGAALVAPASLNLPLTTVFSTTGNNGFSPNTVAGLVANALIDNAEDTANGTPGTLYKTGVSLAALPQHAPLQGEFQGIEQVPIGSSSPSNSAVNGSIAAAADTTGQVLNLTGTAAAGSVVNVTSVGPGNTASDVQAANVSAVGQSVQGDFTATGPEGAWTGLTALNVTSGGSSAGADLLTVAATTAVQLTDTLVSTTTNPLTINGSLTTTITENNGNFANAGITVNGGSGTTAVSITQTEAANGNDGIVKIIDANGASTTAAGTITTITLDGLSNPGNTITDNALTNLTVNNSDGNIAGTTLAITDNLATPTATTLNLSLSDNGVNTAGSAIGGAQLVITDPNNEYSTVHLTLGAQNSYVLFNDNGLTTLDTPTAGTGALVGIAGIPSQINDTVAAAVNFDFSGLNGANAIFVNRGATVHADVYTLGNFGTDINTAGKFQVLTISDATAANVDTINFGSGAYQIIDASHTITAHHNYVNTAANGAGLANLNTASQWALIINTASGDTVLFKEDSVQTLINSGAAPSIAIGIANGLASAAHTAFEFENGGKTFYFDHADNSATITAADALVAVVGTHPINLASLNPVTHAFSIL